MKKLLCLVLAFSFAIIRAAVWRRIVSLLCGLSAHILLMKTCAENTAAADCKTERLSGKQFTVKTPVLLSLALMLPAFVTYLLLLLHPDSVLMINLFPLLNAPFLQIYAFLRGENELFSHLPKAVQILYAVPPLVTGLTFFLSYESKKIRIQAEESARRKTSSETP